MKDGPVPAAEAHELLARQEAPAGLTVTGVLDYSRKSGRPLPARFPTGLRADVIDFANSDVAALPAGLKCYELNLTDTCLQDLPDDIQVESRLDLSGCVLLERLPAKLKVGTLVLRGCTALLRLPEDLDVWFLDLSNCWAFDGWPSRASIRGGRLQLGGCTALRSLPPYLHRLAALNVRGCPNLTSLPPELVITGWLDLAHSGLTAELLLPPGLERTQLRWAGVNIDRRIAFYPETMRADEVLHERNAERRRVLLDRYGFSRFLQDIQAEVLDKDVDSGGPRQLLRVYMEGDEPLVALSCFCPSTGRQYIIRVPPATLRCHQAAAWIAGFDNPDDYRPAQET